MCQDWLANTLVNVECISDTLVFGHLASRQFAFYRRRRLQYALSASRIADLGIRAFLRSFFANALLEIQCASHALVKRHLASKVARRWCRRQFTDSSV